jgi:hypothetical protein
MSQPSPAARLDAAIDRLLEDFRVYRMLPSPTVKDFDRLVDLYAEVTRLALAAGFSAPPPLGNAGLKLYNPHDNQTWPANPPPTWRSPNCDVGKEWEGEVQALQTLARAASQAQASDSGAPAEQAEKGDYAGIQSPVVRPLWEPIFGTYPRLIKALDECPDLVRQVRRGQRRDVHVPDLVRWLGTVRDIVGAQSTGINFKKNDPSTWPEGWEDAAVKELERRSNEARRIKEEKGRRVSG